MRLAVLTLAAAIAALPLPVLAADDGLAHDEEAGLARAAEEMRDPVRQQQVAAMAEAVLDSLLEMPVGSLLQSMGEIAGEDPAAIDPDTTLREVAGPEADEAPQRFAEQMPRMMGAMGALSGALGRLAPELRRIGEDIARELPDAAE